MISLYFNEDATMLAPCVQLDSDLKVRQPVMRVLSP